MEELINQANSKDSFFGTICQITAFLGAGVALVGIFDRLIEKRVGKDPYKKIHEN